VKKRLGWRSKKLGKAGAVRGLPAISPMPVVILVAAAYLISI
jgi:hypothetical protein